MTNEESTRRVSSRDFPKWRTCFLATAVGKGGGGGGPVFGGFRLGPFDGNSKKNQTNENLRHNRISINKQCGNVSCLSCFLC